MSKDELHPDVNPFLADFHALLKKYGIKDTILYDFNGDTMGYWQMIKIIQAKGEKKTLVLSFSSDGKQVCPHDHSECTHDD